MRFSWVDERGALGSSGTAPQPVLVAGPCALEDDGLNLRIADVLARLGERRDVRVVFKGSFDKANRTRVDAARGLGLDAGLRALARVRDESGLPTSTDVHEPGQVPAVAEVVDVLQVPAFLCRQTDLLIAVGLAGKPVNIKKGQWMSASAMAAAVTKVESTLGRGQEIAVTERGSCFGYDDLIVDMRNFERLKAAVPGPVLFDGTHAVQRPGLAADGATGGNRIHVPGLMAAAAAAGADGFFVETHPAPDRAPSDGATMWPLDEMEWLVDRTVAVWERVREYATVDT